MAIPTTEATDLQATIINSTSLRLNFTKGDGDRRLISISSATASMGYPMNDTIYEGHLKFKLGDPLNNSSVTGTCSSSTQSTATYSTATQSTTKTYVVYEGMSDGSVGFDILDLVNATTYQIMVLEHNNYCYLPSEILTVTTGFNVNTERILVNVYDSRTRLPIEGASIAIKNRSGFISDFGNTSDQGVYDSLNMEEGRYEMSIVAPGYDSKELSGIFVQREEPRRADYSSPWGKWGGTTSTGGSNERTRLRNNNNYTVFLDPLDTTNSSFTKYVSSPHPSKLTKL